MARKRRSNVDQLGLLEARVATAPCVPAIREKVAVWRDSGYKGVTDTTRLLLNYWFYTDHRLASISELQPQLLHGRRPLFETPPFPWSRPTIAADKSVFNLVPCDNEFEKEFALFLQKADDVGRFAKLPEQFGFAIEYTDSASNLRYYEPDFVVLTKDGIHYIAETKGLEDVNVANKDRAAHLWCENTTRLTGKAWAYLKVLQTAYKQLQPTRFEDLLVLEQKKLL
jgi:type III restriction enzyme